MADSANIFQDLYAKIQRANQERDWPTGLQLGQRWIELNPEDSRGWYFSAFFQSKLGQNAEALDSARTAARYNPESPQIKKLIGALKKTTAVSGPKSQTPKYAPWRVGSVVMGRYDIRDVKRGGMGEVYYAFDRELDHMVAIKTPLPQALSTETQKHRFYREAEAWIGLGIHPNICSAYYVQEIENLPRLFIEYAPGGTLSDWLKRKKYNISEAVATSIEIASGMSHTHTFPWTDEDGRRHQGLVHRDLKPANILMDGEGRPRVTDFGLVGLAGGEGTAPEPAATTVQGAAPTPAAAPAGDQWHTVTATGAALGTPPYMAPEQWSEEKTTGRAADVYAFGCILYEIFCGARPFNLTAEERQAMADYQMILWRRLHEQQPPPNAKELNPALDDQLVELMMRCIDKSPENRPGSFEEIKNGLKAVYGRVTGRAYDRREPKASRLMADSLNNQGVSYFTIGKRRRAGTAWREALATDPHHLEATYNLSVYEWRDKAASMAETLRRLQGLGQSHSGSHRFAHLMGRFLLYFGEYDAAVSYLSEAAGEGRAGPSAAKDLGLALSAQSGDSTESHHWRQVEAWLSVVMEAGYGDPAAAVALTLALMYQGRRDEAARVYKEAVRKYESLPASLAQAIARLLPGQEITSSINHVGLVNFLGFSGPNQKMWCGSDIKISTLTMVPGIGPTWDEKYLEGGPLRCMALAPEGTLVLAGSSTGKIGWYDLEEGERLSQADAHDGEVSSVALAPDRERGASVGQDEGVRLWSRQDGSLLMEFRGHDGPAAAVDFSPKGDFLATGGLDGTIHLYNPADGEPVFVINAHDQPVSGVEFSPNGSMVVSAGADGRVVLSDVRTGEALQAFIGHEGPVARAVFVPDRGLVVSAGADRMIRIWSIDGRRQEKAIRLDHRLDNVAVSPDGLRGVVSQVDASSPENRIVKLFDLANLERYHPPLALAVPTSVTTVQEREDEFHQYLDEAGRLFNQGELSGALAAASQARAIPGYERHAVAMNLWGELSARLPRKTIRSAWEISELESHQKRILSVSYATRTQALSGGEDGSIKIWDLESGRCQKTLSGHVGPVHDAVMSHRGQWIASGGQDAGVRLWDPAGGQERQTWRRHTRAVTAVSICPEGRFLLSSGEDGRIMLWDLTKEIWIKGLPGHDGPVWDVAFTLDGTQGVSAGADGRIHVWDLDGGRPVRTIEVTTGALKCLTLGPDGRMIVAGGADGIIRQWELDSNEMPSVFRGHTGEINTVDVSPDGKFLLSAGSDRTLRIWDMMTGQGLLRFDLPVPPSAARFSADGQNVLIGAGSALKLWQLDWEPAAKDGTAWDESARPYLEVFLKQHVPRLRGRLAREGQPSWDDQAAGQLIKELGYRGFGYLKPSGVRRRLGELTREQKRRPKYERERTRAGSVPPVPPEKEGAGKRLTDFLISGLMILFRLALVGLLGFLIVHYQLLDVGPTAAIMVVLAVVVLWLSEK